MPRKLKPLEVDEVNLDRAGVRVKIYLDRNRNVFYGKVAGKQIEDASCDVAKGKVYQAIVEATSVEWVAVIEIEKLTPFSARSYEGFIGFTLDRYFVATLESGRMIKTRWFEEEEGQAGQPLAKYRAEKLDGSGDPFQFAESFHWDSKRDGPFRLPWPHEGFKVHYDSPNIKDVEGDIAEEQTFYVAHSPELWAALNLLLERIEEARRRLDELLLSPSGHKMLEAWVSSRALPPAVNLFAEAEKVKTDEGADEGKDSKQITSRRRPRRARATGDHDGQRAD
jgi:hypothetical protein